MENRIKQSLLDPVGKTARNHVFAISMSTILATAWACSPEQPSAHDVRASRNKAPMSDTRQPCVNRDGVLVNVGSTLGEDTCNGAFTRIGADGRKQILSTFTWISPESGVPMTVCLSADVSSSQVIVNPDTVMNVGYPCDLVLGTPQVPDSE